EQHALLRVVTVELDLREHLLEPTQVLHAGQGRILAEPELACPQPNASSVVPVRARAPRRYRQNSRRSGRLRQRITALAGTARDDQLHDRAPRRAVRLDLREHDATVRRLDPEPGAALGQPLEMQIEPADP